MNPTGAHPILIARDIHRSFRIGRQSLNVLRGISLEVAAGESVFLCGASGAGKTTLLYTLAGLERPQAGSVEFEATNIVQLSDDRLARLRNARMGFVFQGYFLLPELTALENAALPALIGGRDARRRAADLLARVGLGDRLDHLPSELSGGEQQRVAIARSLINDPGILFADEPTGNLDSANGEAIMDILIGISRDDRRTLLIVTHDERLARKGDRLLRIEDGLIAGPN